MTKVTAKLNYLHIAPRKVRLIANALKGLSVNEAEAQLLFRPQRPAKPLLDLLRSAAASAKYNHKLNPDKLIISSIKVDQGPMIKRSLPRAMGRATPLQKKMSHISLILEEKSLVKSPRFNIVITKKEKTPKKESKAVKPKIGVAKVAKPKEQVGFFRKMFNRKSV
ncbi:MAG: 50S ribosomal protein L22 [Candidatus Harrisonbacteria bacterium]|nr:50S ribosomal protein L22 [Candidatus Harrisonbacteria bacterium]